MPEERGLYVRMTVRGVLVYLGALKGLAGADLARAADEWLDRTDLAAWADRKVGDLSRGMHQKLQFAVTCVNDPELVILDEPFSGLDPVNVERLTEMVLGMRARGRTVIFSTHVMDQAERLCDAILLVHRGRSVLDGPLDAIRAEARQHAVRAELEGPTDFVAGLPGVARVEPAGRRLEIALEPEADPQDLLVALAARARVLAFEVKVPSLHEIFVDLVSADDEPDA
jgi:ABC-2 type transport system ATP-binding protein